jgi:hypothetical protein
MSVSNILLVERGGGGGVYVGRPNVIITVIMVVVFPRGVKQPCAFSQTPPFF